MKILEKVIGILTRVIPVSVEQLRQSVDSVHRLEKLILLLPAAPRAIILQFGMRTVWDEVWKRFRDVKVCSEMHIRFREDFSKEDQEARNKLWPLVQDARRRTESFSKGRICLN